MFLNTQRTLLRGRTLLALVAVGTAAVTLAACSSTGSSGSGSASGPVTVGELFPFTGAKAQLSDWGTHGVDTGMYEVNHNGGVLGQQMKSVSADDAADSVDALPALRKLLLSDPKVVIGPFSPTIEAVINQFTPNHVADFMMGGTAQLDNMNVPYVFRTFSSDSTEAVAMAYYAIQKGYKTASLIFDNSANSQGFVAPLTAAYKKLGGTVLATNTIVPRPELLPLGTGQLLRQSPAGGVLLLRHPNRIDPVVQRRPTGLPQHPLGRRRPGRRRGVRQGLRPDRTDEPGGRVARLPDRTGLPALPRRLQRALPHQHTPVDHAQLLRCSGHFRTGDDRGEIHRPQGLGQSRHHGRQPPRAKPAATTPPASGS